MSKAFIGGATSVTIPASTLSALKDVTVTGFGTTKVTMDSKGGDVAIFPVTGGFDGTTYQDILHQGSGLTFKDKASDSVTVSDFRIDTQHNTVFADVTTVKNGKTTTLSDFNLFTIGAGLVLTFTQHAANVFNRVLGLGATVTTSTSVGTAAPAPVANPLPLSVEQSTPIRNLFHDHGYAYQSGVQPIVGGRTVVTLTAAATLKSLGVTISGLGTAIYRSWLANPVAVFGITGGTEQASGDTILHNGSGLKFHDAAGTLSLRNLIVDTVHNVVDADVIINGKFKESIAAFTLGTSGSLTLTSDAALALDTTLGLGSALTSSTVVGSAATHPFALTQHEATVLTNLAKA